MAQVLVRFKDGTRLTVAMDDQEGDTTEYAIQTAKNQLTEKQLRDVESFEVESDYL